jgi:outer membrane receptor for Fe3+-dicitrate
MKKFSLIFFTFALPFNLITVFAQSSATITGTITDANGAVVVGATVAVKKPNNSEIQRTTTDSQGQFKILNLNVDLYVVEVMAEKFQTTSKDVRVMAGEQTTVNIQLAIKPVAEIVTVTGKDGLERVPGSIALIEKREIAQSRAYDLKDALGFTPGVFVQSRSGADESQLSIRGSGLRNNYHARGLNFFINGIPYQDADGFSDYESLELMTTQSVEVWKGANALRFGGNSMGGAINLVTNTGETASPLQIQLLGGSFGLFKGQISTGGVKNDFSYYLSFSNT